MSNFKTPNGNRSLKKMMNSITEKIVRHCQRMDKLVKNLLTLADIETLPRSQMMGCDLFTLLEDCMLRVKSAHPDATIDIIDETNHEGFILGDPTLLDLAVTNLMENGAKYSDKDPVITLTMKEVDENVVLQIADQGIGIPVKDLPHIFDRFYTVDKARSRKMGGSGLGLSLVKIIIDKHEATISVSSTVGQGTTFTITFRKAKKTTG